MKEILLKVLADLEDLRANQGLLSARLGPGVSLADAVSAKAAELKAVRKDYADLRALIEALP